MPLDRVWMLCAAIHRRNGGKFADLDYAGTDEIAFRKALRKT